MKLRSVDQTDICDWLAKKGGDKYTSPEIQNEILTLMSQAILHVIARQLQQTEFFMMIITDECIDRHVDENVDMYEEFIVLYECPNILANTVVLLPFKLSSYLTVLYTKVFAIGC